MVTESVIGLVVGFVTWIIETVPAPAVPDWFDDANAGLSSLANVMGSVAVWIPVGLIGLVLTVWVVTWGVAIGIKVVRIIASFLTLGGGSAA